MESRGGPEVTEVRVLLKNGWGGRVGEGGGEGFFTKTARFGSKTCFLR